jgi:hypothetical protein
VSYVWSENAIDVWLMAMRAKARVILHDKGSVMNTKDDDNGAIYSVTYGLRVSRAF